MKCVEMWSRGRACKEAQSNVGECLVGWAGRGLNLKTTGSHCRCLGYELPAREGGGRWEKVE